ncbi:MAG: hypothetical protein WBQ78_04900 [Gammaproteobacteria bacterium]
MHIVLAVLSSVAGLIWALVALRRSGFSPDAINPFLWLRRLRWRKQYSIPPLYRLDEPMDVAAVLLLGTAKCEGEISTEQKRAIRAIFEHEFKFDSDMASDLLLASAYLIRDEIYLVDKLDRIIDASSTRFTPEQAASLLALMTRVGTLEPPLNEEQRKLITSTEKYFERLFAKQQAWKPDTTGG